jgi:hypothetical protein
MRAERPVGTAVERIDGEVPNVSFHTPLFTDPRFLRDASRLQANPGTTLSTSAGE